MLIFGSAAAVAVMRRAAQRRLTQIDKEYETKYQPPPPQIDKEYETKYQPPPPMWQTILAVIGVSYVFIVMSIVFGWIAVLGIARLL